MQRGINSVMLSEDNLRMMVAQYPTYDEDIQTLFNYIIRTNNTLTEFVFNVFCNAVPYFDTLDNSGSLNDPLEPYVEDVMSKEIVIHCSDTYLLNNTEYVVDMESVTSFLNVPDIAPQLMDKYFRFLEKFLTDALHVSLPPNYHMGVTTVVYVLLYNYIMTVSLG